MASQFEGYVWVYPRLKEGELLVVKHRGVIKNWQTTTTIPWVDEDGQPDREVLQLCEYALAWKVAEFDDKDPVEATRKYQLYKQKLAEIIGDCKNKDWTDLKNAQLAESDYPPAGCCGSTSTTTTTTDDGGVDPDPPVTETPTVATPVLTPSSATFVLSQQVIITCATSGVTFRYTTDGTEPDESDPVIVSPANIVSSQEIRVRAFRSGYNPSGSAVGSYTLITPATSPVTFSPTTDYFSTTQQVTLSTTTTPSYQIYYTLDGTNPASSGTRIAYTTPFTLSNTATVKALTTKPGWVDSAVTERTYTKVTSHTAAYFVFGSPAPPPAATAAQFLGAGGLEYDLSSYQPISFGTNVPMGFGAGYGGGPDYYGHVALPFNSPSPVVFYYDYGPPRSETIPMLSGPGNGLTNQDSNGNWFYYLSIDGDMFRVYITSAFTPAISALYSESVIVGF